ncbi:MAG: hypothetical protein FD180_2374 [Planctomycetota bacterium]|nr:MAG: hypothetical protein FD180_2374 [Planctomycetota bacterium]
MAAIAVTLCALSAIHSDQIDLWMRNAPPLSSRSHSASMATVQDVSVALKCYETDFGRYPESGNSNLVKAMAGLGKNGFYGFTPDRLNARGEWLDPWNRPYVYERLESGGFRLYSIGPNGIDEGGKGDDLGNGN